MEQANTQRPTPNTPLYPQNYIQSTEKNDPFNHIKQTDVIPIDNEEILSGVVGLTGRTNVGKSTLMNQIIGEKVAITTGKAQTTRHRIRGIYNREDAQVIFLDTPGVHKPEGTMGEKMSEKVYGSWEDVDVLLFVVDAKGGAGTGDEFIADRIKDTDVPIILAVNKIDRVGDDRLSHQLEQFRAMGDWDEVCPISAKTGENVDELIERILDYLPEGPRYFPDDNVTDRPLTFRCSEIIREKLMSFTRQEVPHSITVVVERIEPGEDPGKIVVEATVYVERESQKGIVIGEGGHRIQEVGKLSRKEMEDLLESDVYLDLHVKVAPNWRDDEDELRRLGIIDSE
jgi:GTP-binding protein Era